jgi:hypothetical protein
MDMHQVIPWIWIGCFAVGTAGATAIAKRWLSFLGLNLFAGVYAYVLLDWFDPGRVARLIQGNEYSTLVLLAPVVMWIMLGASVIFTVARQHYRSERANRDAAGG